MNQFLALSRPIPLVGHGTRIALEVPMQVGIS
jgi:hypothetical protein